MKEPEKKLGEAEEKLREVGEKAKEAAQKLKEAGEKLREAEKKPRDPDILLSNSCRQVQHAGLHAIEHAASCFTLAFEAQWRQ